MLTSAFFFARALSAIAAGSVADRYGFKVSLLAAVCFALNALAVQLYGLSSNIAWFVAVRLVQGALNGLAWVSMQYMLGRLAPKDVRGRAFAVYFAAGTFGTVAGNALYSILSNAPLTASLTASSLLFLATSALTASLSFLVRSTEVGDRTEEFETRVATGAQPSPTLGLTAIVPLAIVVAGSSIIGSVIGGDLTYVYIKEFLGIPKYMVADAVAVSSIVALLGTYALSWVSDKVGDRVSLRLSIIVGLVGAFIMALPSLPLVITGRALASVGGSAVMSVSRKVAVTYYGKRGVAVGIINATSNAGKVLGSLIAGHLYDVMSGCVISVGTLPASCFMLAMASLLLIPLLASVTLPSSNEG
jgi:MFS family permease